MAKNSEIIVKDVSIRTMKVNGTDYLCITDIAKQKNNAEPKDVVKNWMRQKNTLEYLGLWERLHNPTFKGVEFDPLLAEAGSNSFTMSPSRWVELTAAIGITTTTGRNGGTYAITDIAFKFANWVSVEFELYLVMEFQRLKAKEQELLGWTAKRELSKINYRIHTDAIKSNLIPAEVTKAQASIIYAEEADVLNVAMFGMTAKQWREANPELKGNIRDYATINELICLSNMENVFDKRVHSQACLRFAERRKRRTKFNINAVLINDGFELPVRRQRTASTSGANCQYVGLVLRSFRYVACLILMMTFGIGEMWGQIDEGFYYIASNQAKADNIENSSPYSSTDPSGNFYLCPAIGSYYDNNVDLPHLTTFKTNQDQNSLWKIEAVESETNCYYLIHYKTGKYLASNATPNYNIDGNKNRKVVHLEKKADDDDSDIYKFYIINHDGNYQIYPADYRPGGALTSASSMSLNVKGDNWSMYVPYNGLATGIIGVYDYVTKEKANPGSQWKIEPLTSFQPCATPVIKFSGDQINISYPYSDETGITIYYTTDGSEPSTSSSSNTSTSFNIPASGVVKVRAFATKSGCANSDEAVLWGSARPFLIQSKEDANYYLVPAGNGTNINTTSIAGEPMQWTFQNAGASTGGLPYYYLVNSNGKKISYNTDNTLTLNAESADANKFCIFEDGNSGEFFIIPISGASTGNDKSCRAVYKNDGNVKNTNSKAELIKGDSQDNINRVHWLLRICNDGTDQKILFANPPFSVSTDEEIHYYKIANVGSSGYYIIPPVDPAGYATTSNTSSDYTDKPWIFKVAASDNWLTYYYIINAATGEYMYFNIADGKTNTQSNVISMKDVSEKNASNENRFQFVMVRSTTTDACYIVPKGYANNFRNSQYYGISVNGTDPLQSIWSRSADVNGVKWTFESTTYANVWADPVVTCGLDGNITITNGEETDGAEFYYTKNNSLTPPATPTATESETNFKYNSSSKPTVSDGFITIKVRAIASGKGPSNVVTKTIVYNPTITLTADSYTYTGEEQSPISSVDVSSTNIASTEYNVTYKKGGVAVEFKDAGDYTIELTDIDGGDYIVCGSGSLTINKKSLTVTAANQSVTYGSAAPTYTVNYSGFVTGEDATNLITAPTATCTTYTTTSNVGTYNIVPSGGAATNYSFSYVNGTLTVNQREVGLDWQNTSLTYNGTSQAPTANPTNLVNNDAISVTVTGAQTNAGNYTATATALTGTKAGNYSLPDPATHAFTIAQKSVTVTSGITASDKVYDGNTSATLDCTGAVFTGKIENDDLTLVSATGAFADKNVGTDKEVTITGLSFGGAAAGNYMLAETGNQSSIKASISAKDITASGTIAASNKVYDGTTTAVFDYSGVTLAGKVEGDNLSVTATGDFDTKDVGTGKTVTISDWALSGTDVGNYNLTGSSISTTTTANITAKEITVSGITAENKVYNSTTTATLDYSGVILTGKVEGDNLSVTATGTFADANVGTGKAVTISGLTLEGTDAGNYVLAASGQQTEVIADITAKAVTITANNASRDYDGNPLTEAGFTATALEEGDTHTFTVTMTAESTITNAGTQPNVIATVDGVAVTTGNATEVGNYLVTTVDGTLTINGTAITISVNLNDWIYGSPNNPSVTGNTGGGAVTYSYKLQTEDNSKYKADKPVKVGNYTVKAEVAATATTPAATATKDFTISKAPLVINANPIQKDYLDEDPELTYTVSGLKNNDIEYYVLTCKLQRAAGEEKGTYAITKESHNLKSGNYEAPSFEGATFTINKKNIGDGETIAPGIGIYAKKTGETTWDVSLSNGKNKFNSDNDYEIPVVTGPDEDGNYTITVTGKGNNCEGTAKATYSGATFYDIKDTNEKLTPYLSTTSDLATSADLVPYIVAQINPTIGTISIVPISYIPKDQPVLLLAPSDVTGITTSTKNPTTPAISESLLNSNQLLVAPDEPSDPDDPESVHGVHVEDTEAYVFYKGEFVLTLAGTIKAGKYYLYNPNYHTAASPNTPADPAPARSLAIVKGETTGIIQLMNAETTDSLKDVWYTIDGQKLDKKPTRKGLYIHNGKKHIVK